MEDKYSILCRTVTGREYVSKAVPMTDQELTKTEQAVAGLFQKTNDGLVLTLESGEEWYVNKDAIEAILISKVEQ